MNVFGVFCVFFLSMSLNAAEIASDDSSATVNSIRKSIDSFGKLQEKEPSEVNRVKKMFKKGKLSGQMKFMYASAPDVVEPYATALGGILKYELGSYRGFSAGVGACLSYDIDAFSGSGVKQSDELSSSKGRYAQAGELYVKYTYEDLKLRAGRQVLDTPLADADDIRMIQNSFEAYVLEYAYNGLELILGNIQNWSGYDAGLETNWKKTGEDGTNFVGVNYAQNIVMDAWYYNITGVADAYYFDFGVVQRLSEMLMLRFVVQYLKQSELEKSGVEATIYGLLAEVALYDISFNLALNKSLKHSAKESFSGFGGGALFTNMDTMILDEISYDREVFVSVGGIMYRTKVLDLLYAYGDFFGKANSAGEETHLLEQNIGGAYHLNDELSLGLMYGIYQDLKDSSNNWNRLQFMLSYNFK